MSAGEVDASAASDTPPGLIPVCDPNTVVMPDALSVTPPLPTSASAVSH